MTAHLPARYRSALMDAGVLLLAVAGVAFLVLVVLVARKMFRGELTAGEKLKEIDEPSGPDDAALEREALGAEEPALPPDQVPPAAEPEIEPQSSAYRRGLAKTRAGFMSKVNTLLFGGRALDPSIVDELEEVLVTSDIGIRTAQRLIGDLREKLSRKEVNDPEAVRARLRSQLLEIVSIPPPPRDPAVKPRVTMVIGVNGVGKTTTIGKLAARATREGRKVILAAGDTFRAAAVEQLEIWAERSGAAIVKGPEGSDPASVAFEAVQSAQRSGADDCIADTAGRLHTKVNLMEELKKVRRVIEKAMPGAPHEVLLVLDATTGQNAITQAQQFTEAVQVSSLALTKLDGTAKGGVVVAICDVLKLPVRYVGVGERVDDLRDFDPAAFVDALFDRDDTSSIRDEEARGRVAGG